jgi:histidinol-phosphate aminotransferase
MNYLDRNEFNYAPSQEVVEALKNFDINKLCFYTRIYDEGKKSILSVYLSESYGIDEPQVLLGYGGEDILKQAVHYFLTQEDGNKTMLIPKFSWWYYKSIADEVDGHTLQYPLYEDGNTFKYDFAAMKEMVQRENPKVLLIASPNNPTGNGLTPAELDALLAELPVTTIVLVDEAYASFVSTDTDYIKMLVDKYPNLIISRTLSKFYGLPGLRMGFGFMSKELANFGKYSNKYLGYNRISEDIAIAALKSDALILTDTTGIQRTTPLVNNGNFIRRNSIIMYDVTLGTLTHSNDVVCMLACIAAFVVINQAVDQRKTM